MLSYKVFIRESGENAEKIVERQRRELNFRGDEAKKAYEEIIQQNHGTRLQKPPRGLPSRPTSKPSCQKSGKSPQKADKPLQINANVVLKAVEQADLDFLKTNLCPDNVNIADDFGWTPLMSAAYAGNLEIVDLLLKLGADRHLREKSGLTALHLAKKKNHVEVISLLRRTSKKKEKRMNLEQECEPSESQELEEFYCPICNENFRQTTVRKHEVSLLHIFNTSPKLPDPVYGIPKTNKGYQIMLNTGWEESRGLGPSGSGAKYPVKTVLKRDRRGLGQKAAGEPRVTHFKSNDVSAIKHVRVERQRTLRKRDREKLMSREARKERALRRALS